MNILQNNPYRLLGIYANSSARDQLASIHKLEAYLRVGRQTALPLELPGFFPVEEKTVDGIKDAAAKLALPQSKLHYAQFWFLKIDQFDEIAFKHLLDGDIAKAMDIWSKHESVSSLQNRIVCHLVQNSLSDAIHCAEKLYGNTGYISQFVSSVVGEGIGVATDNLGLDFIDALSENVELGELLSTISLPTWQQHVKQKLIAPLVSSIQDAIAKSKQSRGKGAEVRLAAGNTLMQQANLLLTKLQGLLPKTDMQYQSIVDRLANEVLQCGIDYFNNSEDDDAPQKAMVLQKYALSIAAGPMAKDRCKENVEILEKICPPDSVVYYHTLLQRIIKEFGDGDNILSIENASAFVDRCLPYLMSIRSIVGSSNSYYQRMCTRVAGEALSDIIWVYNDELEDIHDEFEKLPDNAKFLILAKHGVMDRMRNVTTSAVNAMHHMKDLDMEPGFRANQFEKNYNAIYDQARAIRCSLYDLDEPDMRDEDAYYSSISGLQDCHTYKRVFPNGKYTAQVNAKIEEYEYNRCSTMNELNEFINRYPSTKYDIEAKREEVIFKSCRTIEDYNAYITNHTAYREQAKARIDDLIFDACKDREACVKYLETYPNGGHRLDAQHRIDDMDYAECRDRAAYIKYLETHPTGKHRADAQRRIEDIDFRKCETAKDFGQYLARYPKGQHVTDAKKRKQEEELWALCKEENSWKRYLEYVDKFPSGKYIKEAKEKALSPLQRIKKFVSKNGCLLTIIGIPLIAIIIGACKNGMEGVGNVFAGLAIICGLSASGGLKADDGCMISIVSLILGSIFGGLAYLILH